MIKQMERRFALVAILVISLVLILLVLAVQFLSYNINRRKTDAFLETIASSTDETISQNNTSDAYVDRIDLRSSRDGGIIQTFTVVIPALSSDQVIYSGVSLEDEPRALHMAMQAIESRRDNGFIEDYRYLVVESNIDNRVYFKDYSYEIQSENILLTVSLVVCVLAIFIVMILVKVFIKPVMKPIRESYEKQKQFITDASHELKTPLTVIATDLQLVEMETGASKWTKNISKQVDRLTNLSNELVVLSRMDEGDNQLIMSQVNLSNMVGEVIYGFEPALKARNKSLDTSIEDGIKVEGQYESIEKLVGILLENALKYTSNLGQIWVALATEGKQVVLRVENTVELIEIGPHNDYFERFYRGDKSRNSQTGGFGIGLAVAKSIVNQHKWQIEAYSSVENKITFKVTI